MVLEHLADVHTTGNTQRVEDDVNRGAVLEEGHVFDREDLGHNALITVAACHLVTNGDLAALGNVDANRLAHAGVEIVFVVVEFTNANDDALFTVGNTQRGIANLASLLTEDGAQQALFGGQLGFALRGDLTDEDVTSGDLGADANDAALVQVCEGFLGDIGDIAGDFFLTELGFACVDFVLFDVNRGEDVLFDNAAAEDDGVLVVEAFPRHVSNQQVLTQRDFTVVGGGAVGEHVAFFHALTFVNDDALVRAVTGVGALELLEAVGIASAFIRGDDYQVCRDLGDNTGVLGDNHFARVVCGTLLHAGTHQRSFRGEQGHRLTLHVRTHEGSVCIVVLEEGDERGCHGHHLASRNVHVIHAITCDEGRVFAGNTAQNLLIDEVSISIDRRRSLCDEVTLFVIGGQVLDLVGDLSVANDTVRGLDETEGVDAGEGCQRTNQTNVRAFRGFNRAHTTVVRGVNVTNLHGGTVTRQTTRAQCRQTTLVRQASQGVVLVHEL